MLQPDRLKSSVGALNLQLQSIKLVVRGFSPASRGLGLQSDADERRMMIRKGLGSIVDNLTEIFHPSSFIAIIATIDLGLVEMRSMGGLMREIWARLKDRREPIINEVKFF